MRARNIDIVHCIDFAGQLAKERQREAQHRDNEMSKQTNGRVQCVGPGASHA